MSTDSLGRLGLNQRAAASALAAHDGLYQSEFFAPTQEGVDALRATPLFTEWDVLARQAATLPFLYPEWMFAWWQAFAEADDRLALWYLRRNGHVVALLPMVHRGSRLHVALNYHTPQFGVLAESPAQAEALLSALLCNADAHEIVVPALDSQGDDAGLCRRAASAAGHDLVTLPHERASYMTLEGGWKAYELQLSRDTKRDLRRRRRRLEELGTLGFDVHDGRYRLPALLEEAFVLEASGWKARDGTAIRCNPRVERFYMDIARWAASEGMLRLCFLRIDGDAIAMQINIEHRGTWYMLKCGYDEQFRQAAPGKLLQYECIRQCFTTGMNRIEFCGDTDALKLRWSPQWRVLERLHLFPATMQGQIARLRVAARPWLKSWCVRLNLLPNTSS